MQLGNKTIILAILGVFGVLLLGAGITGNVIRQSCCAGPDCSPENRCVNPVLENPAPPDTFYLDLTGLLIIIAAAALFYGEMHRHKRV